MNYAAILTLVAAGMGQVDKFETRSADLDYASASSLGDIERCLIRVAAPPQVYRQPDRPDDVTIVWAGVSVSAGNASARVDLRRNNGATQVPAWGLQKQVLSCAPKT
ncbi:hypothetical protein [uncultured Sphingomonas sp.]|uniref:hypothetical protein n=1 Tax=uncultured Sphingomonas sp. TaxID=158754 RepID=UPI0025DD48E6|nr:hypothetical protein [uncultured Sphingomonas sp.]